MTQLFAQPYDISANGFYFETAEEYAAKAKALRNDYGDPVEEFEIQFIDGDDIDCDLAKAVGINQANFTRFFEILDEWEEWENGLLFWPLANAVISLMTTPAQTILTLIFMT